MLHRYFIIILCYLMMSASYTGAMDAKRQELRSWLLSSVKPSCSLQLGNAGFVAQAAMKTVMVTTIQHNRGISCYNPSRGELLWRIDGDREPASISIDDAGNRVVVLYADDACSADLLDCKTGDKITALPKIEEASGGDHDGELLCASFNHRGTQFATGSRERAVQVWRSEDGTLEKTFRRHQAPVRCVDYNFNDDLLVSGSDDATIDIVHLAANDQLVLGHHAGPIRTVSFSRDGSQVVSGSVDKTARVWDLALGTCLLRLKHKFSVERAAMSPDGNTLATTDGERVTALWDMRQFQAVEQCVGKNMSRAQYLLLDDIRQSNLSGRMCGLEEHPLKDEWFKLSEYVRSLVDRYTGTASSKDS